MFRAFFSGVLRRIIECFKGSYLLWQFLAAALTLVLVESGADWRYFESTRSDLLFSLALPAAIIGFFVPVIVPVGLYIIGEMRRMPELVRAGAALAQSVIVAYVVSCFYKIFTGRIQPEFLTHLSTVDISREFQFGFLRNGIFWGWPSSHAAVACAMVAALVVLYPRIRAIKYLALLYGLYIVLGVSVSIHWLSDALAGAIIGSVAGIVVARSFARGKTQ
jgi:hypothetical protein